MCLEGYFFRYSKCIQVLISCLEIGDYIASNFRSFKSTHYSESRSTNPTNLDFHFTIEPFCLIAE